MTLSLILIAVAIALGISLLVIARGQRPTGRDVNHLIASIEPVDLEAFQNLVDPQQERFLSENLTPAIFRRLQRTRLFAAIAYVSSVAGNAAALMRIGELAQNSSDPEIVGDGRQLAEAAAHLRVYSLLVLAKLYVGIIVPNLGFSPASLAGQYQDLRHRVVQLTRLRVAIGAPRIAARL